MTARTDLAESVQAAEAAIDKVFAPLAPQVAASVRKHAVTGTITHTARRAILRDVDRILASAYPAKTGESSTLGIVILKQIAAVAAKPVAMEVARIERVLKDEPVLVQRMKAGR